MSPNGTDDMHDGQTNSAGDVDPSVGDAWLGSFVSQVQSTAWYSQGGNIIIEWDEGMDSDTSGIGNAGEGGGGRVVTLDVSAALKAHPQQESTPVNTAGVLHSIEGAYGLPYLAEASDAANGNIDSLLSVTPPPPTTTTAAPTTTTTATTTTVAPTTTAPPPTTTTAAPTTTAPPTPTTTVAPTTTAPPTPTTTAATTTTAPPTPTTTAAPTPTTTAIPPTTVPLITSSLTTTTQVHLSITTVPTTTAREPAKSITTTSLGPNTSSTRATTTTPGILGRTWTGSGGSDPPSPVSASSRDLAFTGPGQGVGTLGIIGGGLVLLGFALLALVGIPRRLAGRLVLLDTHERRSTGATVHHPARESSRGDLWLLPPS